MKSMSGSVTGKRSEGIKQLIKQKSLEESNAKGMEHQTESAAQEEEGEKEKQKQTNEKDD